MRRTLPLESRFSETSHGATTVARDNWTTAAEARCSFDKCESSADIVLLKDLGCALRTRKFFKRSTDCDVTKDYF